MWKNALLVFYLVVVFCIPNTESWFRRRRRRRAPACSAQNCVVLQWSSWGSCSHQCGTSGVQSRTRSVWLQAVCGGTCHYHFSETRACNRNNCHNGGTPYSSGCSCRAGYKGTCCDRGTFLTKENYVFFYSGEETEWSDRYTLHSPAMSRTENLTHWPKSKQSFTTLKLKD